MTKLATFGGGCFWCLEAIFQRTKGVKKVVSGFAGGDFDNPSYEDLHTKDTGHAEVVQIEYDPGIISYSDLLNIFWYMHDPTTLNRQGNDVGEMYRSIILYHDKEQKELAEKSKIDLEESGAYPDRVVTYIEPLKEFFKAEDYEQNYYNRNRYKAYCKVIIDPKIKKFLEKYPEKVIDSE